jgi:hypothetical protein
LEAVDHGDRLTQMQARVPAGGATGTVTVRHYRFDRVDVSLLVPFGKQTGASLGFDATGTVTEETYDQTSRTLVASTTEPFDTLFAVRRATGGRWLNVGELPAPTSQ